MAADRINFAIGTEFNSVNHFREILALYESQGKCNFAISSSQKLKASATVTEAIAETFHYKYAKFTCVAGIPRKHNEEGDVRRQRPNTKSYRQQCESFFTLSFRQENSGSCL